VTGWGSTIYRDLFDLFLYLGVGNGFEELKLIGNVFQNAQDLPIATLSVSSSNIQGRSSPLNPSMFLIGDVVFCAVLLDQQARFAKVVTRHPGE
jgi:hypothetical protein